MASSEPENGGDHQYAARTGGAGGRGYGGGRGGAPGDDANGDDDDDILAEKLAHKCAIKQEKWWQTTIQVSIPFFLAGIGTIGAGIILGRVEVRA